MSDVQNPESFGVQQAIACETAHYAGAGIVTARSAERLDDVMQSLITTVMPDLRSIQNVDGAYPVLDEWANTFRDPKFILTLARERAVRAGTLLLLSADYAPAEEITAVHESVPPLRAFKAGLQHGGMGRGTARAIIGRVIAEQAEEFARTSSSDTDYNNALALKAIGSEMGVFDWRDRVMVRLGFSEHRRKQALLTREQAARLVLRNIEI